MARKRVRRSLRNAHPCESRGGCRVKPPSLARFLFDHMPAMTTYCQLGSVQIMLSYQGGLSATTHNTGPSGWRIVRNATTNIYLAMSRSLISIKTPFLPLLLLRFHLHKPYNLLQLKPSFTFRSIISYSSMEPSHSLPSHSSLLFLSGKSSQEIELAHSIRTTLKLPEDDGKVSIFLHGFKEEEKKKPPCEETFGMETYMNSLSTERFGRFLIWSPRLSSTQDVVSKNFCELPLGAVCVADMQFKGRGRSKNVWESPPGCLLFSFTLQMEDGRTVPLVQYVLCLAVTEAVKDICDTNGLPCLDVKIKWPNDLYLNGLKVGGILCTSTYKSKKFNVSAGIGLNVDNEQPTICLNAVLREISSVPYKLQREEILAAFFKRFENLFDVFLSRGFQALEKPYYNAWLHSGQRVVIQEKSEGQFVEDVTVTIQGLTSSGYLLATGEDNQLYELHPDGNSFDFLHGLVRRKL